MPTHLAFSFHLIFASLSLDPALLSDAAVVAEAAAPTAVVTDAASSAAAPTPTDAARITDSAPTEGASARPSVADQLSRRARIGRVHKWMGISTWAAMTATLITGQLQYINLYGFFAPAAETRCVKGNAFFGQDACSGTPIAHVIPTVATAALYYTTFGLSFAMPDPLHLDRGSSRAARHLRTHKRLRWVHFTGMLVQGLLGAVIANGDAFGLDRANHYRALQGLATAHLITGYATYGTLTWAGSLMAFSR